MMTLIEIYDAETFEAICSARMGCGPDMYWACFNNTTCVAMDAALAQRRDRTTVLDDGQASGVGIERYAQWVEFDAGALKLGANFGLRYHIDGGPIGLNIHQTQIDGPWTLDTLCALHRDLGRLLAHPLLSGALEKSWGSYDARER